MKCIDYLPATKGTKFRNRYDAEHKVCKAITELGLLAGIDVDQGAGPQEIDPALIDATYQSNFEDPHFLGGPCCFNYAETADDVAVLSVKAERVTRGLVDFIR